MSWRASNGCLFLPRRHLAKLFSGERPALNSLNSRNQQINKNMRGLPPRIIITARPHTHRLVCLGVRGPASRYCVWRRSRRSRVKPNQSSYLIVCVSRESRLVRRWKCPPRAQVANRTLWQLRTPAWTSVRTGLSHVLFGHPDRRLRRRGGEAPTWRTS